MSEVQEIEEAKEKGPVKYRSVSQVNQYLACPWQYKLQRRDRAWQRPAAWFPQGLGVHGAVEAIEKSGRTLSLDEALEVYDREYSASVARWTEESPNFEVWYWSGPYSGEVDLERRYHLGREQVERYMAFIANNPGWKPDRYDGELAIELPFRVWFGDVEVRGFIDNVTDNEPVDVKSGNKPGDDFQLGTYAGFLEQRYGIKRRNGWYWMGRTGKLTKPYDLSDWSQQKLADVYGEVDALILAEEFDPKPEKSKCRFCSVSADCAFSLA